MPRHRPRRDRPRCYIRQSLKRTRVSTSRWRNPSSASPGGRGERDDCGRTTAAGTAPPSSSRSASAGSGGRPPPRSAGGGCGQRCRRGGAASAASALPRASRGAGARQLAAQRHLVDVGRPQRIRLDADLVDQGEPARRAGSQHEYGTADDHRCGMPLRQACYRKCGVFTTAASNRSAARLPYSLPPACQPKWVLIRSVN